jgi:hypothetical protein
MRRDGLGQLKNVSDLIVTPTESKVRDENAPGFQLLNVDSILPLTHLSILVFCTVGWFVIHY